MILNLPSDEQLVEIVASEQMHQAFVLAGNKVEKHPKEETPPQMFHRIREEVQEYGRIG